MLEYRVVLLNINFEKQRNGRMEKPVQNKLLNTKHTLSFCLVLFGCKHFTAFYCHLLFLSLQYVSVLCKNFVSRQNKPTLIGLGKKTLHFTQLELKLIKFL